MILWVGLTLYQLAWRPKAFLDPIGFFQERQLFVSFLKNGGEVSLSLPGFIPSSFFVLGLQILQREECSFQVRGRDKAGKRNLERALRLGRLV